MIIIETPPCPFCQQTSEMEVDELSYHRWKSGALIQDAFRTMSREEREQLKTGFHPKCWNKVFGRM